MKLQDIAEIIMLKEYTKLDNEKSINSQLREYDILLAQNGKPYKVLLVDKIEKIAFVKKRLFVVKLKERSNLIEDAVALYMYLKSNQGQQEISSISHFKTTPMITKKDLFGLYIPNFINKQEIVENYQQEQLLHKEINEVVMKVKNINTYFDTKRVTNIFEICKICKKEEATHLRTDTWRPFERGVPMCDKCSSNIMF